MEKGGLTVVCGGGGGGVGAAYCCGLPLRGVLQTDGGGVLCLGQIHEVLFSTSAAVTPPMLGWGWGISF